MTEEQPDFQRQVEAALGLPHDLMERGREIMAARMQDITQRIASNLEPVLGQLRQGEADHCRDMAMDLAAQIVLQGREPPMLRFFVTKTNKSRSWPQNRDKGRRAERLAARWPSWHRRYKKWMRVAATCGVIVWGEYIVQATKPAERIYLSFEIQPSGGITVLEQPNIQGSP